MNILAFDTAADFLHIALQTGTCYFEINHHLGLKHSEHLLPEIDHLIGKAEIEPSQLDLIICTRGPGSFTGLRIGMATAKGLAAGCGAPLVSIPTLELYAQDCVAEDELVIPVIDARKKRYYTALFYHGIAQTDDLDISAEDLLKRLEPGRTIRITGPDAPRFFQEVSENLTEILHNNTISMELDPSYNRGHGHTLIELGKRQYSTSGADSISQGPLYIRKSEAELGLNR